MNFGTKRATGSKNTTINTSRIIDLVKARIQSFNRDDETIEIMVTELECTDPDCVPLETLIALLGKNARWTTKILKPLLHVDLQDINNLPLPASWSLWVTEYAFRKDHPTLLSWINDTLDDFENKISELSTSDKLMATLVYDRAIESVRQKLSTLDQEVSISQESEVMTLRTSATSNETAISTSSVESRSTVVLMRMKSSAETNDIERSSSPLDNLTRNIHVDSVDTSLGNKSVSNSQVFPQVNEVIEMSDNAAKITTSDSVPKSQAIDSNQDLVMKIAEMSQMLTASSESINMIVPGKSDDSSSNVSKTSMDSSIRGSAGSSSRVPRPFLINSSASAGGIAKRHNKGSRPRGCPCCDPDNIDNIVDRMIFLDAPP